jgi:hypothetical protein
VREELAERVGEAVALDDLEALEERVELNVAVAERLRTGDLVDVTEDDVVLDVLGELDDVLEPVFVLELDGLVVPVLEVLEDLDVTADFVLVLVEDPDFVENPEADADKDGLGVIDDERDPTDVFVAAALRVDVRVAVAVKDPKRVTSAKSRFTDRISSSSSSNK